MKALKSRYIEKTMARPWWTLFVKFSHLPMSWFSKAEGMIRIKNYAGRWFQTCFIVHFIYGMSSVILPIDELILFKMLKTTNQVFMWFSYAFIHVITASPQYGS